MSDRNYKPLIAGAVALVGAGFFAGLMVGVSATTPAPAPVAGENYPTNEPGQRRAQRVVYGARGSAAVVHDDASPAAAAPAPTAPAAGPVPALEQDSLTQWREGYHLPAEHWDLPRALFDDATVHRSALGEADRGRLDNRLRYLGFTVKGLNLAEQPARDIYAAWERIDQDSSLTDERRTEAYFAAIQNAGSLSKEVKQLATDYKQHLFPANRTRAAIERNQAENEKSESGPR